MENKKHTFAELKWYLLYETLLLAAIFAYWWFAGEHSVRRFSDISFLGGGLAMFVGFLIYRGTRTATGNFSYQFASTTSDQAMPDRIRRDWKERFASERLMLVAIIIGGIPMLMGVLAHKIWG
ncbi:MAG: hypothetical protein HN855_10240 [Anaerolineae bacterium]|jgi:hypothetical protein|nr:hypothetical protein [Anaerolineae bacterium]MBT7069499.1 hypothetical protein [Anaerolineae bacterium]MBT7325530.1 hypothetical protein [Anaerolineae bacterium]